MEVGPNLPEQLSLTADEAILCVKAVSYYVTSSLQTLEANWNNEALFAIGRSAETATEEIDRVATFVGFHQNLAKKFHEVVDTPEETVELSSEEIMALGDALFRIGNSGLIHATKAIHNGTVGFQSGAARESVERNAHQTADEAYELFKKLEPIAKSKEYSMWMVWERTVPPTA